MLSLPKEKECASVILEQTSNTQTILFLSLSLFDKVDFFCVRSLLTSQGGALTVTQEEIQLILEYKDASQFCNYTSCNDMIGNMIQNKNMFYMKIQCSGNF